MKKELRKWIIVLTLGLLLGMATVPATAEEYTFRKTTWGMTKEQVKETEKETPYEHERGLRYEDRILGFDCTLLYIFVEGKLVRTKYIITEEHSNDNQYIMDYDTLKAALIKKYGEPSESNQLWKNDLYKDDSQDWGLAISIGHLVDYARWETLQTDIVIGLYGDNYEVALEIQYSSKELKELEKKEEEKEALDVL